MFYFLILEFVEKGYKMLKKNLFIFFLSIVWWK